MKYFINYCDTSGFDILPFKLFSEHQYPASFILALCNDKCATYSGTLRALLWNLYNPRIHAILDNKSDNYCPDYKNRLAALRQFVSVNIELLND